MAIYVTGDTHGEQNRILDIERHTGIKNDDYLIICGDFGYLMRNDLTENNFLDDLSARGYTILFADGNHECFPAIFSYKKIKWNGGYIHKLRDNIYHLMRGQIYNIEGKKFFILGGAYSIDRYMRRLGYSYWEEEMVNDAEYKEAIKNLSLHNNKVDYIIELKSKLSENSLVYENGMKEMIDNAIRFEVEKAKERDVAAYHFASGGRFEKNFDRITV